MSEIDGSSCTGGEYSTDAATGAASSREAAEIYDSWAEDYERRILGYGYSTPAVAAWFLGRHSGPEKGPVLDAGAGTGLMGQILAPLGYEGLVGIDLSRNMLELARAKGVYEELREMELGGPLDLPTDAFAAFVSTGVFAAGHAPPMSFDELIRATRPGGRAIFSVRTDVFVEGGFQEKQESLEREGRWRLLEKSEPFSHVRHEDPDLKVRVFAYEVR